MVVLIRNNSCIIKLLYLHTYCIYDFNIFIGINDLFPWTVLTHLFGNQNTVYSLWVTEGIFRRYNDINLYFSWISWLRKKEKKSNILITYISSFLNCQSNITWCFYDQQHRKIPLTSSCKISNSCTPFVL
jgi:hypothetical protein